MRLRRKDKRKKKPSRKQAEMKKRRKQSFESSLRSFPLETHPQLLSHEHLEVGEHRRRVHFRGGGHRGACEACSCCCCCVGVGGGGDGRGFRERRERRLRIGCRGDGCWLMFGSLPLWSRRERARGRGRQGVERFGALGTESQWRARETMLLDKVSFDFELA